jgi:hypothetical protein
VGGRTGSAEASIHTPWEDHKCLFLDHTVIKGGAIPLKRYAEPLETPLMIGTATATRRRV